VLFIKLIKVLATVFVVGMIFHLLFSAGSKSKPARGRKKFVKSSVIEKKDETPKSDKNNL
jgi:hypothetical protein